MNGTFGRPLVLRQTKILHTLRIPAVEINKPFNDFGKEQIRNRLVRI